jgi:hypothetical protein
MPGAVLLHRPSLWVRSVDHPHPIISSYSEHLVLQHRTFSFQAVMRVVRVQCRVGGTCHEVHLAMKRVVQVRRIGEWKLLGKWSEELLFQRLL